MRRERSPKITLFLYLAAASLAFAQPAITPGRILNTSGDQAKLSPGVVWVIYGSGLGPATLTTATGPNYPDSVGGTSVSFTPTAGGAAITARIWYTLSTQVGGLLPSTIAPGTYAVRVTYNNQTSAPQTVTVVARSMGIATSNGLGNGPSQATIANVNSGLSLVRYTSGSVDFEGYHWLLTPLHPGDDVVLWGTGGGADLANDTGGSSGDQTAAGNFKVMVGTAQITPGYAGTVAGYPGLWQINFHLPDNIQLDCFAPVQVSAGGELSNLTSIAIAAAGQTACSDHFFPQTLLAKLDTQQDVVNGAFAVARIGAGPTASFSDVASGFFGQYTSTAFVLARIGVKFNGCEIYDRTYPITGKEPGYPKGFLDAGRLTIAGGNIAAGTAFSQTSTPTGPTYSLVPLNGIALGASYTLTGAGGAIVGPFTAANTYPASFMGTNWDSIAVVDRTKPLTFTWTGSGFTQVYIQVNSVTRTSSDQRIVTMNCYVPAAPGSFTIPTGALAYIPAVPGSGQSFGNIALEANSNGPPMTGALIAGIPVDIGNLTIDVGYTKNIAIQ
jgi:uncharacterized protein (TIGR03437 family)